MQSTGKRIYRINGFNPNTIYVFFSQLGKSDSSGNSIIIYRRGSNTDRFVSSIRPAHKTLISYPKQTDADPADALWWELWQN